MQEVMGSSPVWSTIKTHSNKPMLKIKTRKSFFITVLLLQAVFLSFFVLNKSFARDDIFLAQPKKIQAVKSKSAIKTQKIITSQNKLQPATSTEIQKTEKNKEEILPICLQNNIQTKKACVDFLKIPVECREKNILDFKKCEIFLKKPKICRDLNIQNRDECKNLVSLPLECVEARIFDKKECAKYQYKKTIPDLCRKNNIKTQKECQEFIVLENLPKKCKEKGILNQNDCQNYIFQQTKTKKEHNKPSSKLNPVCLKLKTNNTKDCLDKVVEKYGKPMCSEAGIYKNKECYAYLFNKFNLNLVCKNKQNCFKDEYLIDFIVKQNIYQKLHLIQNKKTNINQIKQITKNNSNLLAIKNNTNVFTLKAKNGILVDKTLKQSAPMVLFLDTDGDGLSDDFEQRWGTDYRNKDTDGDGYDDGVEIKNGFNPLGNGYLKNKKLSPIDTIILDKQNVEQAKNFGAVDQSLKIDGVENINNNDKNQYLITGKAPKNSVFALYIYSDIPLLISVKTDEYGNWKYILDKELTDDKHEIYLVVNDKTGKVIKKSNPFAFFVKEAKAVSIDEVLQNTKTKNKRTQTIKMYLVLVFVLVVFSFSIFIVYLLFKKNKF